MTAKTHNIINIYTGEFVGTIEMTEKQYNRYMADHGPTGAITIAKLNNYGDEMGYDDSPDNTTVYVEPPLTEEAKEILKTFLD